MKSWPAIIALALMAGPVAAQTGGWSRPVEWTSAKALDGYVMEYDGRYVSVMPAASPSSSGKIRVELMSFWRFPEGSHRRMSGGVDVEAISQLTEIDCESFDYVTITNVWYAGDGRRFEQPPVNMGGAAGPFRVLFTDVCDGSYRTEAKYRFTTIAEFLGIRDEVAKTLPPRPQGTWRIVPPKK